MSHKTKAQARREAYQAISLMTRARAFAVYTTLNVRGKIKAGDSFQSWWDRCVARTVADWATPSNTIIGA